MCICIPEPYLIGAACFVVGVIVGVTVTNWSTQPLKGY